MLAVLKNRKGFEEDIGKKSNKMSAVDPLNDLFLVLKDCQSTCAFVVARVNVLLKESSLTKI